MIKNKIDKNILWNTIGVTLNAITSLLFLMIATRINGKDNSGIFTFAFSIALLIQTIGVYSGRTFQVTESNKKIKDSDYIYTHIITSLSMILICIIFCIFKSYNLNKSLIIFILVSFRALEALEDSLFAILQKNNRLYKVGISFTIKAIIEVLLFLIIDIISKKLLLSSLAILISQIIILLFYDIPNLKKINFKLEKFNKDKVYIILKTGLYTFIFFLLSQLLINIPKLTIDSLLPKSNQTIYGIISMPTTVMILLGQYIIQPILNKLSNLSKEFKYDEFNKLVLKVSYLLTSISIFIIVVAYFIGIPFLELLYKINLKNYKIGLTLILIGALLYGITNIIANALITIRKTKGQTVIYGFVCLIGFIVSKLLVSKYKLYGAIYIYDILMLLLLLAYITYYIISINKRKKGELV